MNAAAWIAGMTAERAATIDAEEDVREARKEALLESDSVAAQLEKMAAQESDAHEDEVEARHAGFSSGGEAAKRFLLAGNARVTLVSKKTGTRFTFRVRAKEVEAGKDSVHFVSVLTGANNDADYSFLGTIFGAKKFVHGKKSSIGSDAPSAKAFAWAIKSLLQGVVPATLEVHHEGRCGKCGRALTVPESIETGLGPVCAAGGTDR